MLTLSLLVAVLVSVAPAAQHDTLVPDSSGWIAGTVRDSATREVLVGASVVVDGTEAGAATDIEGSYLIGPVRVGGSALTASHTGYRDHHESTSVFAGCTTRLDLGLRNVRPPGLSPAEESIKRAVNHLKSATLRGNPAYDDRLLVKAWNVWLKGRGSFTVKKYTQYGVEGGRIFEWLIIKDGTCRLVTEEEGNIDIGGMPSYGPHVYQRQVEELWLVYEPDHAASKLRRDLTPRARLRLVYDAERVWRDAGDYFP